MQNILHLPGDDSLAIDYMAAIAVVNTWHTDPEPVWGYLVGPPGSAKTEILRTLDSWSLSHAIDELTPNALASGADDENSGEDHSLLPKLNGKVLIIKDFTTFIGMSKDTIAKVLSVLRAAYDGAYAKSSAKAGLREYSCKFGIIAAVTPVIDRFLSENQKLGERFLMFRIQRRGSGCRHDRVARLTHVRSKMQGKSSWRAALRITTQSQLNALKNRIQRIDPATIAIPPDIGTILDNLADLLARLRTAPFRGTPADAESGSRLVQQLTNLARARAVCECRIAVTHDDLRFVRRIAEDTLPALAHSVYSYLLNASRRQSRLWVSADQICQWTKYPPDEVHDLLNQYQYLSIAERAPDSSGRWRLTDDSVEQANVADLFSLTTLPQKGLPNDQKEETAVQPVADAPRPECLAAGPLPVGPLPCDESVA